MYRHDDPSHDIIVVIPGILGSRLERNGRSVWGFGAAALNIWRLGRKLAGDLSFAEDAFSEDRWESGLDDGVRPAGLLTTPGILPGFVGVQGYNGLVKELRDHVPDRQVIEFAYDWRQSNRVTAQRLHREISPAIQAHRKVHPEARLQLVCHSMGGLVGRFFAEVLDTGRHTRRVITIGTPYLGAVKALPVLANGDVNLGPMRLRLGGLARSLPGVAELLPIYRCLGTHQSDLRRLDDPNALATKLPPDLLKHARQFHTDLASAVAHNGPDGPTYHPIIGHLQRTDLWASLDAAGRVVNHRAEDLALRGDGTVPRISAAPPEWRDDAMGAFFAGKHAAFHQADDVGRQLLGVLTSQPRRAWMSSTDELVVDAADWAEPNSELTVYAETKEGASNTPLEVALRGGQGGEVDRQTMRWSHDDGRYVATLRTCDPGNHSFKVTCLNTQSGVQPVSDVVLVAASEGVNEDPDG